MKDKSFDIENKRYKTTHLPGFILRIKGKLDSRKGANTIQAFVKRLVHRVYVLESQEYLLAEELLKNYRTNAAQALFVLNDMILVKENNKVALQQNRGIAASRAQASATVIEANEKISNVHSLFAERILKIRNYNDSKLQQYFSGVTIEVDKSYTYTD